MREGGYSIGMSDRREQFRAQAGCSLLSSLLIAGLAWLDIGCRSGGCGVCRIRVVNGQYDSLKMSRSRISEADEAAGIVLACRIFPKSDMRIEPLPLGTMQ
jgi:ferredoxin